MGRQQSLHVQLLPQREHRPKQGRSSSGPESAGGGRIGSAEYERSVDRRLVLAEGQGIHPRPSLARAPQWSSQDHGGVRLVAESAERGLGELDTPCVFWPSHGTWAGGDVPLQEGLA